MFSCLSAYAQQDSAIVAKGERLLNLGYGVTVKAKESSAAISEVTGEEIMKSAATNPLNALYGKGLGLTVLQNGGTVWESVPTTMIRGLNSTRDNSILVLIDGFERDLSMITKEEIESVQILKDAAATALYGLRGANGVMLVTTKTGSKKKIDVSVNYEHHFNMLNRLPKFADGYTYALAMNEAMKNDEMQQLAMEISPAVTAHGDEINMNPKLFARIKALYDKRETLGLDALALRTLELYYNDFVRGGANLNDADKAKMMQINGELAKLGLQYGDNLLKETNAFTLVVDNENDLAGLPETSIAAAAAAAGRRAAAAVRLLYGRPARL